MCICSVSLLQICLKKSGEFFPSGKWYPAAIAVYMTGVDASPFMTWGEIEGTPFRLDGSDTPVVPSGRGPTFKIPEVPRRDRLLHELAEKASKSHRAKKEVALKQATASLSRFQ